VDVIGIELKKELRRRAHGRDAFSGPTAERGRAPEQLEPTLHRLVHERHHDLFFAREVLVDGSFGVFQRLGNSIHAQTVVTVPDDHRPGQFEDSPLAILHLSLFSGKRAVHTGIMETSSFLDKRSILTFCHFSASETITIAAARPRLVKASELGSGT